MKYKRTSGFTLIELLVVVGIIIMLSAVMLADTNKFGGQSLLQNLAYDIALSVREAQVYGISVQNTGTSGDLTPGYGMYFSTADSAHYHLFADTSSGPGVLEPDGVYEAGEDVSPSPYSIGSGFQIYDLCVTGDSGEDCSQTSLTLIFLHPEPDAYIDPTCSATQDVVSGQYDEQCSSSYSSARIIVSSPRGDYMSIVISSNGQISVNSCGVAHTPGCP